MSELRREFWEPAPTTEEVRLDEARRQHEAWKAGTAHGYPIDAAEWMFDRIASLEARLRAAVEALEYVGDYIEDVEMGTGSPDEPRTVQITRSRAGWNEAKRLYALAGSGSSADQAEAAE